jgi:hypothetical protein
MLILTLSDLIYILIIQTSLLVLEYNNSICDKKSGIKFLLK